MLAFTQVLSVNDTHTHPNGRALVWGGARGGVSGLPPRKLCDCGSRSPVCDNARGFDIQAKGYEDPLIDDEPRPVLRSGRSGGAMLPCRPRYSRVAAERKDHISSFGF